TTSATTSHASRPGGFAGHDRRPGRRYLHAITRGTTAQPDRAIARAKPTRYRTPGRTPAAGRHGHGPRRQSRASATAKHAGAPARAAGTDRRPAALTCGLARRIAGHPDQPP